MSLIPFFTTWLIGWSIYRLIRQDSALSPEALGSAWLLGTGAVGFIHYLSIVIFQANPPTPLVLALAAPALWLHPCQLDGWSAFRRERLATLGLLLLMATLLGFLAMSGFTADATRMWLAKAQLYAQKPDYTHMIENLYWRWHPSYPPLFSHQYQWQLVFTETTLGLKLPLFGYYVTTLMAVFALLRDRIRQPVLWTVLTAGFPIYWWFWPLGTADPALAAFAVMGLYWVGRHGILSALILGLMPLVKTEGLLLLACMLVGILVTERSLRTVGMVVGWGAICTLSWWSIVWRTGIEDSDFALLAFSPDRIVSVLDRTLPILLNPVLFAFLWFFFFLLLLLGYWKYVLLWLPTALYVVMVIAAYTFSTYHMGIDNHIHQSMERILLQVVAPAMVYLGLSIGKRKSRTEAAL